MENESFIDEVFPSFQQEILIPKFNYLSSPNPEVYNQISQKTILENSALINSNPDIKDVTELTIDPESVRKICQGTLQLINTVISESNSETPIDTLLFLDKSARNGAFLYNELLKQLTHQNKIPNNVKFPQIRFINIGMGDNYDKFRNSKAKSSVKRNYHQQDFDNKTIGIVDEYSQTGESLKKTSEIIQENFDPKKIYKLNQFNDEVPWYGSSDLGISGVLDQKVDSFLTKPATSTDQKSNFLAYRSILKSIIQNFATQI